MQKYEIVQVSPIDAGNTLFAGAIMMIEEVRPWGCVLSMKVPGRGFITYRATYLEIVPLINGRPNYVMIEAGEGYIELNRLTQK